MRVVAVRDAAHRMAEEFDRRFGAVLVVKRRASLPEVFEFPGLAPSRLNVLSGRDPREVAELSEAVIWPRFST